ncbi:MAG: hypothetical protein IPG22_06775 [Acidobacteria bacterium]|nr:hypothetical protein [Acidobacteriota bacterium]
MKFQSLAVTLFACSSRYKRQQSDDLPVPASFRLEGVPSIKNEDVKHLFFEPSAIKNNLIWDVDRAARRLFVTDEKNAIYSVESPLAKPKLVIDRQRREERMPFEILIRFSIGSKSNRTSTRIT